MYNFRLKGQLKTEVCFLIIGLVIHWFKLRDYKNSLQVVKPIYVKKERHAYSGTLSLLSTNTLYMFILSEIRSYL